MYCPVYKSGEIRIHMADPIRFGGPNMFSHYSCLRCDVLFYPTEPMTDAYTEKESLEEGRITCLSKNS
jgi:hypothetical protein